MTRPAHNASNCAVSLAWLLRFAREHGIRQRGLTTAQVVSELVIPATEDSQCCYADLLRHHPDDQQRGAVSAGRPFYFVSHAWGRPFCETVDMVAQHFSPAEQRRWRRRGGAGGPGDESLPPIANEEAFVWLDVFAINQHAAGCGQQADDPLTAVREAVGDAEETLLVLDHKGTSLGRIWCLYEAWLAGRAAAASAAAASAAAAATPTPAAAAAEVPAAPKRSQRGDGPQQLLSVVGNVGGGKLLLPPLAAEEPAGGGAGGNVDRGIGGSAGAGGGGGVSPHGLRLLAYGIPFDHLKQAFINLNVKRARATKEADRSRILAELESEPEPEPQSVDPNPRTGRGGPHDTAHALKAALVAGALAQVPGPDDEQQQWTSDSITHTILASGLCCLYGRQDDAQSLARRCVDACERLLGAVHPNTLKALEHVVFILRSGGKCVEAERAARKLLQACEHALGRDHHSTLAALHDLASILGGMGRQREAEPAYWRCLEASQRLLGFDAPGTLQISHELATLLAAQGKDKEAEVIFMGAYKGRERFLGANHPDTLATAHSLARLLKRQGNKLREAEALCCRVFEGSRLVFGTESPQALRAICTLGEVLLAQGRAGEAEPLLRLSLQGLEVALGRDHPDTLAAASSLATLLLLLLPSSSAEKSSPDRNTEAAEALLWRVLEGRERSLGPGHPDTLAAAQALVGLLTAQPGRRRCGEAESVYQRLLERMVAGAAAGGGDDDDGTAVSVAAGGGACRNSNGSEQDSAVALRVKLAALLLQSQGTSSAADDVHARIRVLLKQALETVNEALGSSDGRPSSGGSSGGQPIISGGDPVISGGQPTLIRVATVLELVQLLLLATQHDGEGGMRGEAEALLRRTLQRLEGDPLADHGDTMRVVKALTGLLEQRGRYADAEEHIRRALKLVEIVHGPDDSGEAADLAAHLARVVGAQQAQEEARGTEAGAMCQRAPEGTKTMCGDGECPGCCARQEEEELVVVCKRLLGKEVTEAGAGAEAEAAAKAGGEGGRKGAPPRRGGLALLVRFLLCARYDRVHAEGM